MTIVAKLNEEETELLKQCESLAKQMSERHGLHYRKIIPVDFEHWGRCNPDGILEIAFYKFLPSGHLGTERERWTINKSEVLRTLAHELAHLNPDAMTLRTFRGVVIGSNPHGRNFWRICNQYIREISELTGVKMKKESNCYGV
jgi:predicted metal-dependent hydrolase